MEFIQDLHITNWMQLKNALVVSQQLKIITAGVKPLKEFIQAQNLIHIYKMWLPYQPYVTDATLHLSLIHI